MRNNCLDNNTIEELYEFIAKGDLEALKFIKLWSTYAHRFDDLIDEEFNVAELIKTNNELTGLLTCKFFQTYTPTLLPQLYLAAEAYQASETVEKDTMTGICLSHEGNNMLRTVALICGGFDHLLSVSIKIRELTLLEHPLNH